MAPPARGVRTTKRDAHLVAVALTTGKFFKRVAAFEPDRIVGVYRSKGDPARLLEALMEDMNDVATRLD